MCFASIAKNVVILGDLNAGCSYVTARGWRALRLRTDPKFHWLIGDEEDTTVREKTRCAYDRSVQSCLAHARGDVALRPLNSCSTFVLSGSSSTDVR